MTKFIPIYEYTKRNGIAKQNVYRWIRENKFQEGDIETQEIIVKRIRIKEDAKPKLGKKSL